MTSPQEDTSFNAHGLAREWIGERTILVSLLGQPKRVAVQHVGVDLEGPRASIARGGQTWLAAP